ncbi:hypothetical protein [Nocardia sp. NPDC058705]|uniref:hypothetical protein n=1 Tax=Nocardia sp. NPDC058705 TaxID=3346609 RepID=UPI003679D847
MTTILSAGWAVVSKQPGAHSDYAILESSRGPCPPAHVKQHVLARSPGNSPLAGEGGAAGLPWVWFMPVKGDDGGRYLGAVIRTWTQEVDATNRPIATNRFVCVPVEEMLAGGCGLADLYNAVREASLPTDAADPCASSRLELRVRPSHATSPDYEPAALLAAAAAVLDGPVKLRGGPSDLLARLAVLDSVAQLLPAGARVWLSAAAWSDATADPTPRLAFAKGGRSGDAVIDLRTGTLEGRALSETASDYRRILIGLRDSRGADAVALHLSKQTAARERSANAALVALNDMDLKRIVLDSSRAGTVRVTDIRRFGSVGLNEYNHDELAAVVGAYARIATLADLAADTPMLGEVWTFAADEIVAAMTRGLRAMPTAESVRQLAALAMHCECPRLLGDALSATERTDSVVFTHADVVTEIVELSGEPAWTPALAPFIAESTLPAIEVARSVFVVAGGHASALSTQLDSLAAAESVWIRVSNALRRMLFGEEATPADVDTLWHYRRDLVGEVLDIVSRTYPARLPRVLDMVLPALRRGATAELPSKLFAVLRDLEISDPGQQAAVDFVVYLQGQSPPRALSTGKDYRHALVDLSDRAQMTENQRENFLYWVTARLDPGWTVAGPAPVLETLWMLTHPAGAPTPVGVDRVARAIVDDIHRNGYHVLADPAIKPWSDILEQDKEIGGQVLMQKIRAKNSVTESARALAELARRGTRIQELMSSVRTSGWFQQPPAVILDLATQVTAELAGRVDDPHSVGAALIGEWIGPNGRPVDRDSMAEMVVRAQAQLELAKQVAKLIEPHTKGPSWFSRGSGAIFSIRSDKDERGRR